MSKIALLEKTPQPLLPITMQEISQLSCFAKHNISSINGVSGGLSQSCYRVESEQGVYFVKRLSSVLSSSMPTPKQFSSSALLAQTDEAAATQIAAAQGLAPQVYYQDPQWLVSGFIEAKSLAALSLTATEKHQRALTALWRCHELVLPSGGILPKTLHLGTVIANLQASVKFTRQQQLASSELSEYLLRRLADQLSKKSSAPQNVLCHGDGNLTNILLTDEHDSRQATTNNKAQKTSTLHLVDFECACLAPREYDLAMFIAVNNLPHEQLTDVIDSYQQITHLMMGKTNAIVHHISTDLVTCYLYFSYLINALWYFAMFEQTGQLSYQNLAWQQLERLSLNLPLMKNVTNQMR